MPVILARLEEHAVAGADDFDGSALALAEADALGDEDGLACGWVCHAVRAPGVKWTFTEANVEVPAGSATASM